MAGENAPLDCLPLSEGQKACLRLVIHHHSSKEIARRLDISPHTVDQRLRLAARALGVSSRFQAARVLARAEGATMEDAYQPLIYQAPYIAEPHSETALAVAPEFDERVPEPSIGVLRSTEASFVASSNLNPIGAIWPLPVNKGDRNDLSSAMRIMWIVTIALGSLFAFGSFIGALEGLSRLM